MRETHKPGSKIYKPGDEWRECDRCGLDKYLSQLSREPVTRLLVCEECLDEINPGYYHRHKVRKS